MFQQLQLQKHAAIACSVVSMRMGAIGRDADRGPRCCHLTFNSVGQDLLSLSSRGVSMPEFTFNQAIAGATGGPTQPASKPNLDKGFNPLTMIVFFGILAA